MDKKIYEWLMTRHGIHRHDPEQVSDLIKEYIDTKHHDTLLQDNKALREHISDQTEWVDDYHDELCSLEMHKKNCQYTYQEKGCTCYVDDMIKRIKESIKKTSNLLTPNDSLHSTINHKPSVDKSCDNCRVERYRPACSASMCDGENMNGWMPKDTVDKSPDNVDKEIDNIKNNFPSVIDGQKPEIYLMNTELKDKE